MFCFACFLQWDWSGPLAECDSVVSGGIKLSRLTVYLMNLKLPGSLAGAVFPVGLLNRLVLKSKTEMIIWAVEEDNRSADRSEQFDHALSGLANSDPLH